MGTQCTAGPYAVGVIAAVLLTYRRAAEQLSSAVHSLLDDGEVDLLVVVDNGDQAPHALAGLAGHPRLLVVSTERNLGYAGGMNVGLRIGLERGARAIAVLNDDLRFPASWLAPLTAALAGDDRLGVVQPMLLHEGTDPPLVNSMGVVVGPDGAGTDLHRDDPADRAWPALVPIDRFSGGAALLSAVFLRDVGLFDDRFFMYYEDVDLSNRGRRRGWRYACVPASRVWHEGSATASTMGPRQRYLQERNRLWTVMSDGAPADIGRAYWLSVRRLRHAPRGAHARALLGGLAGAPRRLRGRFPA